MTKRAFPRERGTGCPPLLRALATLAAALFFAAAPAAAGPLPGGMGFVTLLVFDSFGNPVLTIDQAVPTDSAGATQQENLGPLEGEALLRFDPDPLGGYELRLANPTAMELQGALVIGLAIVPTAGGPTGYAAFEVEYADDGGGGLAETVQHTTFLTEDDNRSTATVVPGLSFAPPLVVSESPIVRSAGPVPLPAPVRGTQFLELGVQVSFTLSPGDSVVFRGTSSFPAPPAPACDDGLDMDGDGLADFPDDPGCDHADDVSERSPALDCDDGLDGDGDGWIDFHPDPSRRDPGCRDPGWPLEDPECQDGVDNDGKPGTDFDGGASVGVSDPNGPDPECSSQPWKNKEKKTACGLGFELALLLPLRLARRRRRGPDR